MALQKNNICTDKNNSFPFSICLQEYCDLLYNEDVEKSCETFCDPVFYTASSFSTGDMSNSKPPSELLWMISTHSYQMVILIWGMIVTPLIC